MDAERKVGPASVRPGRVERWLDGIPRDAVPTSEGGWRHKQGCTTTVWEPPRPLRRWRYVLLIAAVPPLALAVLTVGPLWLAWATLSDVDKYSPHPGEVLGTVMGANAYYVCGGFTLWGWWTGHPDWTDALIAGAVALGACGLLVLWAWNDYRRRKRKAS